MTGRLLLGLIGLAGIGYGLWLLPARGSDDLVDAAVWMVGVVVVHDAVLAPLVLLLAVVVSRVLPPVARAPVVVAFVVLGTVTLVAVPVLGRFGATPGNETLLDRDYVAGWFLLAGLTAVGVAGAVLLRRARGGRSADDAR